MGSRSSPRMTTPGNRAPGCPLNFSAAGVGADMRPAGPGLGAPVSVGLHPSLGPRFGLALGTPLPSPGGSAPGKGRRAAGASPRLCRAPRTAPAPGKRKMALGARTWVSSVPIRRRTRRLRSFRAGCMSRGHSDVLACGAWVLPAGGCVDADALPAGAPAAAPAQQPGRAACGLCCAEPRLCIFMVPVPARLPPGQGWAGWAGAAPSSPRAAAGSPARLAPAERRALRSTEARSGCGGCQKFAREGGEAGVAQRDPRASLTRGGGRAAAGGEAGWDRM
jgi:hypothetical protein